LNFFFSPAFVSRRGIDADCDAESIHSNTFSMEWPPRSGKRSEFPEVDRAAWFTIDQATQKILKGQLGLLEELRRKQTGS
jgi:predicted NUDIX family NTP pyrophosphohydrolase